MTPTLLYDENEILKKVSRGDEMAFSKLFEQWHQVLASYIFRITRSKELAAEIVQDVFLKIWMSREALDKVENFRNYLFIVSRNHAINILRRTLRDLERMKDWRTEVSIRDTGSASQIHSDDAFPEKTIYTLIDEAIESLPPRQKEVFLLHRHQRMTYVQIAEKLNIGRESVKTHLGLAIKAISKYLNQRAGILMLVIVAIKKIL